VWEITDQENAEMDNNEMDDQQKYSKQKGKQTIKSNAYEETAAQASKKLIKQLMMINWKTYVGPQKWLTLPFLQCNNKQPHTPQPMTTTITTSNCNNQQPKPEPPTTATRATDYSYKNCSHKNHHYKHSPQQQEPQTTATRTGLQPQEPQPAATRTTTACSSVQLNKFLKI